MKKIIYLLTLLFTFLLFINNSYKIASNNINLIKKEKNQISKYGKLEKEFKFNNIEKINLKIIKYDKEISKLDININVYKDITTNIKENKFIANINYNIKFNAYDTIENNIVRIINHENFIFKIDIPDYKKITNIDITLFGNNIIAIIDINCYISKLTYNKTNNNKLIILSPNDLIYNKLKYISSKSNIGIIKYTYKFINPTIVSYINTNCDNITIHSPIFLPYEWLFIHNFEQSPFSSYYSYNNKNIILYKNYKYNIIFKNKHNIRILRLEKNSTINLNITSIEHILTNLVNIEELYIYDILSDLILDSKIIILRDYNRLKVLLLNASFYFKKNIKTGLDHIKEFKDYSWNGEDKFLINKYNNNIIIKKEISKIINNIIDEKYNKNNCIYTISYKIYIYLNSSNDIQNNCYLKFDHFDNKLYEIHSYIIFNNNTIINKLLNEIIIDNLIYINITKDILIDDKEYFYTNILTNFCNLKKIFIEDTSLILVDNDNKILTNYFNLEQIKISLNINYNKRFIYTFYEIKDYKNIKKEHDNLFDGKLYFLTRKI